MAGKATNRTPSYPPKVFISYTGEDLAKYADVVVAAARKVGWHCDDHRDWAASGERSVKACVQRVLACDVLVVLSAHRYGWVPPKDDDGGDGRRSITWIETDTARDAGHDVLPYVVDGDAEWKPKWIERGAAAEQGLAAFKATINATIRNTFSSPEDLAAKVMHAFHELDQRRRPAGATAPVAAPTEDPLLAYRRHVAALHSRLVPFAPDVSNVLLSEAAVEVDVEPDASTRGMTEIVGKDSRRASLRALLDASIEASTSGVMPRWLILGDPGAGKTTLARNLVRRFAEDPMAPLPIFTSVARLAKSGDDLATFAASDVPLDDASRAALVKAIGSRLEERANVFVFLDGFDEVPGELRKRAWETIGSVETRHPSAVLVVLSRTVAFERKTVWPGFQTARVAALDAQRQHDLATRLVGKDVATDIVAAITAHTRIGEFARNPLLLTLLAFVARDAREEGRAIPADGARLFGAATSLLLGRGFSLEPRAVKDQTAARQILQALSHALHRMGGETWSKTELSDLVWKVRQGKVEDVPDADDLNFRLKETWDGNDAFFDDVAFNAGVIGPHDGAHEKWRYLHRSIREFLVAERLRELPAGRGDALVDAWLAKAKSKPGPEVAEWAEVFQLYLTLTNASAERMKQLIDVSAAVGGRAVRGAEHLKADERVELALRSLAADASGRDLLLAAKSHPEPDVAAKLLMEGVTKSTSVDDLSRIHWALEQIARRPDRAAFFEACGRPLAAAPRLAFEPIRAGRFEMGSDEREPQSYPSERPHHPVALVAFDLATTPITAEQYRGFAAPGREQARTKGGRSATGDAKLPATDVSWWEARLFCAWIGARLPSEAEWEYACRAGTTTAYWSGRKEKDLARVGWYDGNSGGRVHPVGEKPANPWGLFDVHGNVWEWCEDEWHPNYEGAPSDGSAWLNGGGDRVIRGGSYLFPARDARSAYRSRIDPGFRSVLLGFRPARSVTA